MVKCGVFFAVRDKFLNNILTTFDFKGLIQRFVSFLEFQVAAAKEVSPPTFCMNFLSLPHDLQVQFIPDPFISKP
jgi:hypothetical protein